MWLFKRLWSLSFYRFVEIKLIPIDGHVQFQFFVIINDVVIYIFVHMFFWLLVQDLFLYMI